MRVNYIGIELSILQITFRLVFHGVVKNLRVVQYGPKSRKSRLKAGAILRTKTLPCITKHNCSFWNMITIIFIIVGSHMGKTCRTRKMVVVITMNIKLKGLPIGAIKCQRSTSLITALIYGRNGRSSKPGKRFGPTTTSISAWAFFWTSGCNAIARNSVCTTATV